MLANCKTAENYSHKWRKWLIHQLHTCYKNLHALSKTFENVMHIRSHSYLQQFLYKSKYTAFALCVLVVISRKGRTIWHYIIKFCLLCVNGGSGPSVCNSQNMCFSSSKHDCCLSAKRVGDITQRCIAYSHMRTKSMKFWIF